MTALKSLLKYCSEEDAHYFKAYKQKAANTIIRYLIFLRGRPPATQSSGESFFLYSKVFRGILFVGFFPVKKRVLSCYDIFAEITLTMKGEF